MRRLLEMLVCVACHSELDASEDRLDCRACGASYPVHPSYIAMRDEREAEREPQTWQAKAQEEREYAEIAERLARAGVERFATHLNFGYVPNGRPQRAAIEPEAHGLNRNSLRLLLEVVGDADLRGRDVVDIGCGRGGNGAALVRYFQPRLLVGLDLCEANIAFCSARNRLSQACYLVGDAERLPFAAESFDVALNIESAHAYPHRGRFYREVYRILKPGGVFLYTELMLAEEAPHHLRLLEETGLLIERDEDVTANVLLSCDENARQRTGRQGIAAVSGGGSSDGVRDADRKASHGAGEQPNGAPGVSLGTDYNRAPGVSVGIDRTYRAGAPGAIADIGDFIALPGSRKYEEMRRGERVYRMMKLVKPD